MVPDWLERLPKLNVEGPPDLGAAEEAPPAEPDPEPVGAGV